MWGGHQLHFLSKGEKKLRKSPTIVLDSGLGMSYLAWKRVQKELSKSFRVCSYDKAGYGWSESSSSQEPRTSRVIADELYTLLKNAGESGPYVLVGHSFGGFNIRAFASKYPEEVHSMVLVDASEEQFIKEMVKKQALLSGKSKFLNLVFKVMGLLGWHRFISSFVLKKYETFFSKDDLDRYISLGTTYKSLTASLNEMSHLLQSANEMEEILENIPLVVISQGYVGKTSNPQLEKMKEAQKRLLQLSKNTKQVIAGKSDHCIPFMQPEIIGQTILSLVDEKLNSVK